MTKDKETPLMRQYNQVKKKYPDTILLFRLGDFYETFGDDAVVASQCCGITLTKRNGNSENSVPLAGFPHHQLDNYLPKLVRAGHRVAVCEQLEDPKQARGIVRRDVVEVVTPGVALYDKLLETKKNTYVAGVFLKTEKGGNLLAGISCADASTGEFFTTEVHGAELMSVLETLAPAEILVSKRQQKELDSYLEKFAEKPAITKIEEWIFEENFAREALLKHFKTANLKGFGIEHFTAGIAAAGAVLNYIGETQKGNLPQFRSISAFNPGEYMMLDHATRRNLEIIFSMNESQREGSLIAILDKTQTAMGGRLFKKWMTRPLRKIDAIRRRLESVRALKDNYQLHKVIRAELAEIGDLERLISKVCTGRATPRDIVALKKSLEKIPRIQELLNELDSAPLKAIAATLLPLKNVVEQISGAIVDEPSLQPGTGNIFKSGFSKELDDIREAMYSGKNWIIQYQESERQATGIPSLKVSFTSVFGYYIEITNTHKNKAPEHYDRKQTLANAERYTTPALKEIEAKILGAEEKITELEQKLLFNIKLEIAEFAQDVQSNATRIAALDCLQSFAEAAMQYNYSEPEIDESEVLKITNGRHPVVERLLPIGEKYVANSTLLKTDDEQIHIITGPNMAGKSSYLRQTALVVLLAQIGSFVPAESAQVGIVDRIFTRVGAQDNITAGESTFLVEMQEAANILNNATRKSLILLDEVGRGTATFDGISIAWAIAEYIHNHIGAKTLFATHYHELNELAAQFEKIENYRVEVEEVSDKIIFTHRISKGQADHSFGIHVAEMAGLPKEVIARAGEILKVLESGNGEIPKREVLKTVNVEKEDSLKNGKPEQFSIFEIKDDKIRAKIAAIDINNLTPMQAFQLLAELHSEALKT
ncbi:MAG: DNA mismatch repair protein MutS [Bacteroidota bacterium]